MVFSQQMYLYQKPSPATSLAEIQRHWQCWEAFDHIKGLTQSRWQWPMHRMPWEAVKVPKAGDTPHATGGTRYRVLICQYHKVAKKVPLPLWKHHSNRKMYQKNPEMQTWPDLSSSKITCQCLQVWLWHWGRGLAADGLECLVSQCPKWYNFAFRNLLFF